MYTIKIQSVNGSSDIPVDIRFSIYCLLKDKLQKEAGIRCGGVWPFQGKHDFLTVSGFVKLDGTRLTSYKEWVLVNKIFNEILDELKIQAYVRNLKHSIRTIKEE